jgi:hypothetical protein
VIKSHFRKARVLEKGHQSESSEQISQKCLVNLRSHKSYLWELPSTKALILPHNINLMHQECNVAESIISMCFDITGFSKDNINARKDLAALYNHPSLEPKRNTKGNLKGPWAPYCLKLGERKEKLR